MLLCCEGRSKPGVWPHLGQILPYGSVPLPRDPQGTHGAPGTLQPGFVAMRFPAEPGASPPLPLHPPGTSTPKSPTDPSSKALSDHFTSSPMALTVFSRVETLCGGSASPAGARGDPLLSASALETLPWPRTLARTSPSPPSPRAALPWSHSRLTLPRRLVPFGSCHCTASSSPEPAHCSGGLLLEIDLINAWAMRFLGFPLIPLMQICRTHRALHWLAGRPWARGGLSRARRPRCKGIAGMGGSAAPALTLPGCSGRFSSAEKDVSLRKELSWVRRTGGRPCRLLVSQALPRRSSYVRARGHAEKRGCCRWRGANPPRRGSVSRPAEPRGSRPADATWHLP